MGWSSLERMFNVTRAGQLTNDSSNSPPLRDVCPETTYARERNVDPVSKASYDVGAELVGPSEFWMLTSYGAQIPPLANSDILVRNLPVRRIRARKNIYSRRGVRIGPDACGAYANRFLNPQYMPPALRKSSPREIGARGQIGRPSDMQTGACFGYSAMGYRSWEAAYGVPADPSPKGVAPKMSWRRQPR